MKQNPLKTLCLILFVIGFGRMQAQNDLLSINTAPANVASVYASVDKLVISDFKKVSDNMQNIPVVSVRSESSETIQVRIFTMSGELEKEEAHTIENGLNDLKLDFSELSAGVYMVQFYTKEGSALRRFIKTQ